MTLLPSHAIAGNGEARRGLVPDQVNGRHVLLDPRPVSPDLNTLEYLESSRAAHRKLDPELKHVDLRLQIWSPWARPHYEGGYPTRSVTERAGEGGILARDPGPRAAPEWPEHIVEMDRAVASLPNRHMAAIHANYFNLALPAEQRARIYIIVAQHLTRIRPSRWQRTKAFPLGPRVFREDLDRARWSLKALLRL